MSRAAGRGGAVAFVVLAASGLGSPLGTVSGPFLTPGARRSWGSARAAGAGGGSDPSLRSPVTGHRCDCGWPTQTLLPPPLWPCSSPLPCPRGRAGGGARSARNLGRGAQGRGVGEAAAFLNSTRPRPQVSGKAKAEDELVKAELSVAVCKQNRAWPFINRIWRPSPQQHPPPDPSPQQLPQAGKRGTQSSPGQATRNNATQPFQAPRTRSRSPKAGPVPETFARLLAALAGPLPRARCPPLAPRGPPGREKPQERPSSQPQAGPCVRDEALRGRGQRFGGG